MQCNYRQYRTAENKPAKIQSCITLWRLCGCQSPTPGDNLGFIWNNNWAFCICCGYELVKSLFALHPGAPDGSDSPCRSFRAASFTLQDFSSSCTCKLLFWQFLCKQAPCLNLAGKVRKGGWRRAWNPNSLGEFRARGELCCSPQPKKKPFEGENHIRPSALRVW